MTEKTKYTALGFIRTGDDPTAPLPAPDKPLPRRRVVCTTCGSDGVLCDAWAQWDEKAQAWALASVGEATHCAACDGECSTKAELLLPDIPEVQAASNRTSPLADFLAQAVKFEIAIGELQDMSADHFGEQPPRVSWALVGSLAEWNRQIARVTDQYYKRGEFAPEPEI